MKDKNGMEHDEGNGQFVSKGASTPAEQKRADELTGNSKQESIESLKEQEKYEKIKEDYKKSTNPKIVDYIQQVRS